MLDITTVFSPHTYEFLRGLPFWTFPIIAIAACLALVVLVNAAASAWLRRPSKKQPEDLAMSPYLDHGYPPPHYGPSGPLGKLGRLEINKRKGRPSGEGLPEHPFNSDSN